MEKMGNALILLELFKVSTFFMNKSGKILTEENPNV